MKRLLILFLFLISNLAQGADHHPTLVTVSWGANSEPDIGGYRLYIGEASGNYTMVIDCRNVTSYDIDGILEVGKTYFLAATAYNTLQLESEYSDEISFVPTDKSGIPSPPQNFRLFD